MHMDISLKKMLFKKNKKELSLTLQIQFLKRLHQLLDNGYPLIHSLRLIQLEKKFKVVSSTLEELLINGTTLGSAFKKLHFHTLISSFLTTVETTGYLKNNLLTCIRIGEQQLTYTQKIKRVIRYPIILLVFFIILFSLINYFVLPSFESMITSDDSAFSMYIVMNIIKSIGLILATIISILYFLYLFKNRINQTFTIEQRINHLKKIPLINYLMTLHTTFLFSTQLSTLLKSGLTLKNTLAHLAKQSQMPIISHYSKLLIQDYRKGGDAVHLLHHFPLIDQQLALLFQNQTNMKDLAKDLAVYNQILFDEFEHSIMKIIQMIQPIFFSLLAIFIILMYISILWPMFDLINHL